MSHVPPCPKLCLLISLSQPQQEKLRKCELICYLQYSHTKHIASNIWWWGGGGGGGWVEMNSGGIGGGVGRGGVGMMRSAFTVSQWQELEHQALIYKYLMAGVPVPPDLVLPIQKSFDSTSHRFFHHSSSKLQLFDHLFNPSFSFLSFSSFHFRKSL